LSLPELTEIEREKYKRQMMLEGFGEEGQRRLKASTVLVTRVGGLGGPAALELAVAGIGGLILVHGGELTLSNLNRQILARHYGVGKPRMPAFAQAISEVNPDVKIEAIADYVNADNAASLVERADLVIDAPPTFEERFLLNAEIVRQRKPMVEAAMWGMEAHLTTILPGRTPCLACIYPEAPEWPWRGFPVLGAVSASVGCLAAVEAIKVLADLGEPLAGKFLAYDTLTMEFRRYSIRRRPECPVCFGI